MNKMAMVAAKAVGDGRKTFDTAKKLFHAKLNVIEKAARRKVKPITPRQELNRLWNAESALHKAEGTSHICAYSRAGCIGMCEAKGLPPCPPRDKIAPHVVPTEETEPETKGRYGQPDCAFQMYYL